MIIKPENIKIVVKCPVCNAERSINGKDDNIPEAMFQGLTECVCPECHEGELELSHFETI